MQPALRYSETIETRLSLAVMLRDAFTCRPRLEGGVRVAVDGAEEAYSQQHASVFLFLKLVPGNHTVTVASTADPPVYQPVAFPVMLPQADPLWPAYPDRSLADLSLPLDSPAQPGAYRSQFLNASLLPTVHYPFPEGAAMVRGIVRDVGGPLAGAVISLDGERRYETSASGEYAAFLDRYKQSVAVSFVRPGYLAQTHTVSIQPQTTSLLDVLMLP